MNITCDCKNDKIGRKVRRSWLCEHNTLEAFCPLAVNFWSDTNEDVPSNLTFSQRINCYLICGDENCKEEKTTIINTISKYKQFRCDKCRKLWKLIEDCGCRDNKIGKLARQGRVWICPHNSLSTRCENLLDFWDIKNEQNPDEIYGRSALVCFLKCQKCGIEWERRADCISKMIGCDNCYLLENNVAKLRPDLVAEVNDGTDLSKLTAGMDVDINWKCSRCGHVWNAKLANRAVESSSSNCHKCTDFIRITYEEFLLKAYAVHGEYMYPDEIPDNFTKSYKLDITCELHGVFPQSVREHLGGHGCPVCGQRKSKGNDETAKILKELGCNFRREVGFPRLKDKKELHYDFGEIDILPDELIEYDGDIHFTQKGTRKSSNPNRKPDTLEDRMRRDIIKDQFAIDNGLSLLRIPYTKFSQLKDILTVFVENPFDKQYIYTYPHYAAKLNFKNAIYVEVESPPIIWE